MRKAVVFLAALGLMAALTSEAQAQRKAGKKPAPDEAGLAEMGKAHDAAFKAGDAKAVAGLYAKDADFLTADGTLYKGRDQIEKMYAAVFADSDKGPKMTIAEPEIRFIKPTVALLDGTWELTDVPLGDEKITLKGRYTVVAARMRQKWQIVAGRAMTPPPNLPQ